MQITFSSSSLSHWNPYLQLWMASSMWTPELEAQIKDIQDGFGLSLKNPWRMFTQLCRSKEEAPIPTSIASISKLNRLLHYTLQICFCRSVPTVSFHIRDLPTEALPMTLLEDILNLPCKYSRFYRLYGHVFLMISHNKSTCGIIIDATVST